MEGSIARKSEESKEIEDKRSDQQEGRGHVKEWKFITNDYRIDDMVACLKRRKTD